jgi:hypothetical protein
MILPREKWKTQAYSTSRPMANEKLVVRILYINKEISARIINSPNPIIRNGIAHQLPLLTRSIAMIMKRIPMQRYAPGLSHFWLLDITHVPP